MVRFECIFGDRASTFGVIFALTSRPNKLPVGVDTVPKTNQGVEKVVVGSGRRSKRGPKQGQNTTKTSFSTSEPEAEKSAKEFFNTVRSPYSITYAQRPAKHCLLRAY
jgi:hypothetical protein